MNQLSAGIELDSLAVAAGDHLTGRVILGGSAPGPLAALTLALTKSKAGCVIGAYLHYRKRIKATKGE